MKLLSVPFYPQQKEDTCLLACLQMVLGYYNTSITEADLENLVPRIKDSKSFHIADVGSEAIRQGFETSMFCFDLSWIFSNRHIGLPKSKLVKKFESWIKSSQKNLRYRKPYLNFLRQGGEIAVRVPNVNEITALIDKGVPVITSVESRPFFGDAAKIDAGHGVVVVGYDQKHIYIHDPLNPQKAHAKGEGFKMDRDQFTFCWYRRYANTLVIKRK